MEFGVYVAEHLLEIIFGLLAAGALAFCKYLHSQNKKLKAFQEADKNREYRKMIMSEIEPIIDELQHLKTDIANIDNSSKTAIQKACDDAEQEHEHMYKDLNKIQAANDRNFQLIINSYKFRLIQLCKSHLRDNYITESDFEQISEMYKLYHGLGGNGQAQEYYDKVLELDLKPDGYKPEQK